MVITLIVISVCVVISIIITLIVLIALNDKPKLETTKGQLISKCPFGVKTSSKKPTKFFPGFLP